MKISREFIINGIPQNTEYELTEIELYEATNENLSKHDKAKILNQLNDLEYNVDEIPEEIISDLASQFRTAIDDAIDDFVLQTIRKNEESLEDYKFKWKLFSKEVTLTLTKEYTIKARTQEEANGIFNVWSESNVDQMVDDLTEDAKWNGEFDYGYTYEEEDGTPDYADISEEDL